MIKVLIFTAILCAAVIAGPLLAGTQGFVHIAVGDYIIESSATTTAAFLIVAFIVFYVVINCVRKFIRIPKGASSWFRKRGVKKALSLQDSAFLAYEEGDYEETLALMKRSGDPEDLPLRALFVAAKAAFNVGKYDLCRKFLDQAESFNSRSAVASKIVRAKLNLRVNNAKAALEDLESIKENFKNKLIYRLYLLSYQREDDVESLAAISDKLVRHHLITEAEAEQIKGESLEKKLQQAKDADDLKVLWRGFSKQERKDPKIMGAYVNRLIQTGDLHQARSVALSIIKEGLDPDFLESIACWEQSIPEVLDALIAKADKDGIASGVNLPLLKAKGNLELKAGFYQEALDDYRRALEFSATSEIYNRIGQVLARQQNFAEAADCFIKAQQITEKKNALTIKPEA